MTWSVPARRAILAFLLFFSPVLLRTDSVAAAPYTLKLCATEPNIPGHHEPWTTHSSSAWSLENRCPHEGYVLSMSAPATRLESGARFTLGLRGDVESIAMRIYGGQDESSGVRQEIKVCDLTGLLCGRPRTSGSGELYELRAGTEDFPVYPARMLVIEARCEGEPDCEQTDDVIFSDLEVTALDESPPGLWLSPEPGQWWREPTPLQIVPVDDASGGHRLRIPGLVDSYETGCADIEAHIVAEYCIAADPPFAMVEPESFPQGVHRFTAEIFDGAGNRAEREIEIKYDSVAPSAPENLRVEGARNGWTHSTLLELRWDNGAERHASQTASGLSHARVDKTPSGEFLFDAGDRAALKNENLDAAAFKLLSAGSWEIGVTLIDNAGNESERVPLLISVDPQPPAMPEINTVEPVGASQAARGVAIGWFGPTGGYSGVCGHSALFDAAPASQPSEDPLTAAPGFTGTVEIGPEQLAVVPDGRHYLHLRSFSCADRPSPTAHRSILIDRVAPDIGSNMRSRLATSSAPLNLTAREFDGQVINSGVKSIEHRIGSNDAVVSPLATVPIELIEGENVVRARSTDRAGNTSPWREFRIIRDTHPPRLSISPLDASDPTLVRIKSTDPESGVVEVAVEARLTSGGEWRRLLSASNGGVAEARIPDDGSMPDGRYSLRAVARDAAGHVSSTAIRSDGSGTDFQLPLRPPSSISLRGLSRPIEPRRPLLLDHDERLRISGVLRDAAGGALASRRVELIERRAGGVAKTARVLATDSDGRFRCTVGAGVSRRLEFRFIGDRLTGRAESAVEIRTRAKISLSARPTVLRGRGVLTLRGRIDVSRAALPQEVLYVTLRPLGVSDRQQIQRVPVASDGSFVASIKYSARRMRLRVRYQARIGRAAGWPFAPASSNAVNVELKP